MSKIQQLASKFRLPDVPSGAAYWTSTDLMGSTHEADFEWNTQNETLRVTCRVDSVPSLHAQFHVVARSLRLQNCSGFPDGVSGSKDVANYLATMLMQGNAPELSAPSQTKGARP